MKKSENRSRTSNKTSPSKRRASAVAPARDGLLIILSAPSGCGKTTLTDRLLKRHPEWIRSVSVTTRPPRLGEKEAQDYFFVDTQTFQKMLSRGELLESAKVFDYSYGTPKSFIIENLRAGKNIILAIDVQGTKQIKGALSKEVNILTFFVLPPSVKVLRERLEGRNTESAAEIERRIELAQEEIKEAGAYDYAVMNQNLEETVLKIEESIKRFHKERRPRINALHIP